MWACPLLRLPMMPLEWVNCLLTVPLTCAYCTTNRASSLYNKGNKKSLHVSLEGCGEILNKVVRSYLSSGTYIIWPFSS